MMHLTCKIPPLGNMSDHWNENVLRLTPLFGQKFGRH
jgi:hypothetical protein